MAKAKSNTKPVSGVYTEPSTRALVDWTPTMLRAAMVMAEAGNLRYAAELCESLMGDGRVQAALSQRVQGLLGLPMTFEGKSARAVKATKEDWPKAFPENLHAQALGWGILLGVGLGENDWRLSEATGRVVPRLKVWHPRWLSFDWQRRQWQTMTDPPPRDAEPGRYVPTSGQVDVHPGDGRWLMFLPYGDNRPWMRGVWRTVARAWLSKAFGINDWARQSEVYGQPTITSTSPVGATPELRKELAGSLGNLGSDTSIVLPPGFDVKLLEATGRTWETFKSLIDWACTETSIAILGQNMTSEVKSGGSYAAAKVHENVAERHIKADAAVDSSTLREQAWEWWAEYNFGDRELAPFASYDTDPPKDKKANADTLKTVADALVAFKNAGAPVDARAVLESMDIPMTKDDPTPPPAPVVAPPPAPEPEKDDTKQEPETDA